VIHNLTLKQVCSVNYPFIVLHIYSPFTIGTNNGPIRCRFFSETQRYRTTKTQNNVRTKGVSLPKHAINTKSLLNSKGNTDQWLASHHGRSTPESAGTHLLEHWAGPKAGCKWAKYVPLPKQRHSLSSTQRVTLPSELVITITIPRKFSLCL
jgi:hypothetical protein